MVGIDESLNMIDGDRRCGASEQAAMLAQGMMGEEGCADLLPLPAA